MHRCTLTCILLACVLSPWIRAQVQWQQLGTGSPVFATAAFDQDRNRILAVSLGQAWEYDGTSWLAITTPPNATPPSDHGPVCYDPIRRRTVYYGPVGYETWEHDGTTWTMQSPGAPFRPADFTLRSMAFHMGRGKVLRLSRDSGSYNLWEWDGISWQVVPSPNQLPSDVFDGLCYDLGRNRIVVFGAVASPTGYLPTTWEWEEGAGWQQPVAGGPQTSPSFSFIAYDSARQIQVLFTVVRGSGANYDTIAWERSGGGLWISTNLRTPAFGPINGCIVYDSRRSLVIGLKSDLSFWSYGPVNPATYVPHAGGCAGPVFAPLLTLSAPWNVPWLGNTMQIEVRNAPLGLAFLTTGLDDQFAGTSPLPLDLTSLGMTGCSLRIEPLSTRLLTSPSTRVITFLPIPSSQALLGVRFFQQAATPDPAANGIGMTMTNSMAAVVGTW